MENNQRKKDQTNKLEKTKKNQQTKKNRCKDSVGIFGTATSLTSRDTCKDSKNSGIKQSDLQPEFCAKTEESDC